MAALADLARAARHLASGVASAHVASPTSRPEVRDRQSVSVMAFFSSVSVGRTPGTGLLS